jgi:opacity protein-like surface antigen
VQGETGAQRAGTAQREINEYGGEKGISSVGGTVGYGVDGKTVLVGVDYRYNIRDRIRLAPSVLYLLENDYRSTLYVNADVHYLARVAEKITMYPVGGLGLSVWNIDIPVPVIPVPLEENDILPAPEAADSGTSETKVRIGLNLGFGAEMRVTKDVIIGAEFRYNLTSERIYDQAMFLARAAYYF